MSTINNHRTSFFYLKNFKSAFTFIEEKTKLTIIFIFISNK